MLILILIAVAGIFFYGNVYLRAYIKNPKNAKSYFIQSFFVGIFNPAMFFPLSIVGNSNEQKLRRRANFFLAMYWVFFTSIFAVMIFQSYE